MNLDTGMGLPLGTFPGGGWISLSLARGLPGAVYASRGISMHSNVTDSVCGLYFAALRPASAAPFCVTSSGRDPRLQSVQSTLSAYGCGSLTSAASSAICCSCCYIAISAPRCDTRTSTSSFCKRARIIGSKVDISDQRRDRKCCSLGGRE